MSFEAGTQSEYSSSDEGEVLKLIEQPKINEDVEMIDEQSKTQQILDS